jgi:hypothetical protein
MRLRLKREILCIAQQYFNKDTGIIHSREVHGLLDKLIDITSLINILAFKYISGFFTAALKVSLNDRFEMF